MISSVPSLRNFPVRVAGSMLINSPQMRRMASKGTITWPGMIFSTGLVGTAGVTGTAEATGDAGGGSAAGSTPAQTEKRARKGRKLRVMKGRARVENAVVAEVNPSRRGLLSQNRKYF